MNGNAPHPLTPEQLTNVVRRERTVRLFARARLSIEQWLQLRGDLDFDWNQQYVGRHESQRKALRTLLVDAVQSLADEAAALPADMPAGELFDRCRVFDEAAVWLERVWEFYRIKFDQRDHPVTGSVVRAADEVVWSCYHPVMARVRSKHRPQPLPFLASEYSPAALESDKPVPAGLRPSLEAQGWSDALRAATSSLPVTLLRLPPWCIQDPWWLVFVAHEVGHHVQADLGLVGPFATAIEHAAAAAGGDANTAGQWGRWAREIFADVFSIMMIGRSAVRAVAEVERSTEPRMRIATAAYPPPVVRLELMECVADMVGLPGDKMLSGDEPGAIVKAVAAAALAQLPGVNRTLIDLCDVQTARFGPTGAVGTWTDRLLTTGTFTAVPTHDTARWVIAGSLEAWLRIAAKPDANQRETDRARLATVTIEALLRSAPPDTRGPLIDAGPAPDTRRLVDALLEAARTYGAGQGAAD